MRNSALEASLQSILDEGSNVWVIGDVHGHFNTLKALIKRLSPSENDAIVMLGTGMPTLQPILDCANWDGAPVTSCMLSLAWRTVLYLDNQLPSAENMLAWCGGATWYQRMSNSNN